MAMKFATKALYLCIILLSLCSLDRSQARVENCYVIYSHGITDTHKQAYKNLKGYIPPGQTIPNKRYIIFNSLITFDFPDATEHFYRVNWRQTCFAQSKEIQTLADIFFEQQFKDDDSVILMGVSRGASTIITFMDKYGSPLAVKALVLESPFDCMENVIKHMIHKRGFSWIRASHEIGMIAVSCIFKNYKRDGVRPIDVLQNLRLDLPILLVCSATDHLVPVWSTINLYKKLRELGHKHVYLLILAGGKHSKILQEEEIYGTQYQDVTHAFYKKYNLPYTETFARRGEALFEQCQPDNSALEGYYRDVTQKCS